MAALFEQILKILEVTDSLNLHRESVLIPLSNRVGEGYDSCRVRYFRYFSSNKPFLRRVAYWWRRCIYQASGVGGRLTYSDWPKTKDPLLF